MTSVNGRNTIAAPRRHDQGILDQRHISSSGGLFKIFKISASFSFSAVRDE